MQISKEAQLLEFKSGKTERGISTVLKETKTLRAGSHAELDQALYIWFRQKRELVIPVTGPLLLEQAKYFFNQFYSSYFTQQNKNFCHCHCRVTSSKQVLVSSGGSVNSSE